MKVLLGTALLLALVAEGYSLTCYTCNSLSGNCTQNTTVCNTTNHSTCRSFAAKEIFGAERYEYIVKGCGHCIGLISFNTGRFLAFLHTKCCSSDLCNDEVVPEKEDPTLNGLECNGCFTLTEAGCNKSMVTVKCRGQQDHCAHTSGQLRGQDISTYVFKGCASDFVCRNKDQFNIYGVYPTNAFYCCKGNMCNRVSRNFTRPTSPPITLGNTAICAQHNIAIGILLLVAVLILVPNPNAPIPGPTNAESRDRQPATTLGGWAAHFRLAKRRPRVPQIFDDSVTRSGPRLDAANPVHQSILECLEDPPPALFKGTMQDLQALSCYSCTAPSHHCSPQQITCQSGITTCVTISSTDVVEGVMSSRIRKTCGPCSEPLSFNTKVISVAQSSTCCDSDLCNDQEAAEPVNTTLGGLECRGCFNQSSDSCSDHERTVKCVGPENRCMNVSGKQGLLPNRGAFFAKGCVSEQICQSARALSDFRLLIKTPPACCKGNLCNGDARSVPTPDSGDRMSSAVTSGTSTKRPAGTKGNVGWKVGTAIGVIAGVVIVLLIFRFVYKKMKAADSDPI
ncbi:uncharacterized protein [Heptranchias perlo]|uniref:uncharacterized protein n=1 Tax=Heptranchias perlo TaxID=212740 RepID=UPI003559B261